MRRIDPTDGNAYTRREFIEQYGGLDQWRNAAPVRNTGPLVEAVKEKQRQDPLFKDAWVQWCQKNTDGTCDPSLMDDEELSAGMAACVRAPSSGGRGAGGPKEMRIDPADGNAYTCAQFVDCYGGVNEWLAAKPAGRGAGRGRTAGGAPPIVPNLPSSRLPQPQPRFSPYTAKPPKTGPSSAHDTLADVVKQRQRNDAEFREAWRVYCEAHAAKRPGDEMPRMDPSQMTPGFLRRALAHIGGYNMVAVEVYANAVMAKQRENHGDFKTHWAEYCRASCNGTCDPRRLTEAQLEAGLGQCDPQGLAKLTPVVQLVSQVKDMQQDPVLAQRWKHWCIAHNEGTCDPTRCSEEQLRAAVLALQRRD